MCRMRREPETLDQALRHQACLVLRNSLDGLRGNINRARPMHCTSGPSWPAKSPVKVSGLVFGTGCQDETGQLHTGLGVKGRQVFTQHGGQLIAPKARLGAAVMVQLNQVAVKWEPIERNEVAERHAQQNQGDRDTGADSFHGGSD